MFCRDTTTLFDLEHLDNGCVALKAASGKYVTSTKMGNLSAKSSAVKAAEQFEMVICNKQQLILVCEHGYVGLSTSNKVECNKANYTLFQLEASTNPAEKGEYYIKGNVISENILFLIFSLPFRVVSPLSIKRAYSTICMKIHNIIGLTSKLTQYLTNILSLRF